MVRAGRGAFPRFVSQTQPSRSIFIRLDQGYIFRKYYVGMWWGGRGVNLLGERMKVDSEPHFDFFLIQTQ